MSKLIRAKTASYIDTVALTVFLHDSIVIMADEVSESKLPCALIPTTHLLKVRLVWPGALTVPKLLYYINRYVTIAVSLYGIAGLFIFPWEGITSQAISQEDILLKRCTQPSSNWRFILLTEFISRPSLFHQYGCVLIITHADGSVVNI